MPAEQGPVSLSVKGERPVRVTRDGFVIDRKTGRQIGRVDRYRHLGTGDVVYRPVLPTGKTAVGPCGSVDYPAKRKEAVNALIFADAMAGDTQGEASRGE